MKFTEDQIQNSIAKAAVDLDRQDLFALLKVGILKVGVYAIAAVAVLFLVYFDLPILSLTLPSILAILGLIAFVAVSFVGFMTIVKFRCLRLEAIETRLNDKQSREMIAKFAKVYGWKVANNRKNLLIIKTKWSKKTPFCRSERLTVIIEGSRVWATSFCDPYRQLSFRSLVNRKNNLSLLSEMLSGSRNPNVEIKKGK